MFPTYVAYKDWKDAKSLATMNLQEDALVKYETYAPFLSDQVVFLFEYGQLLSKGERYEESNQVLAQAACISCDPMIHNVMGKNHQAMKAYQEAEGCFLYAAHLVPSRIYPYYLLALLYVESGEMDKAKQMASIVLTKEPKVDSPAVREMRERMRELLL